MPVPRPRRILPGAAALVLVMASSAVAQDDPAAVPYLDDAGNQLGTILVRDFADPYTEFEPSSPPGEGLRYVLMTLTFEAAQDQAFPTDPYQVQLLDADGYLHYTQRVPRPADDVLPDLQSQTLAPFDRVSGVIPYVLPADAEIAGIVYRGGGRLMPIVDMGGPSSVAVGEPRAVTDAAGTMGGSVTVRAVEDPFTDHDPNAPPAEGMRYVVLDTVFEAAEDLPLQANPGGMLLVATDGRLFRPSWIPRPQPMVLQNLEQQPLSPGDRVSGIVGYAVPEDVIVDSVVFSPEGDRFISVIDL